jgi:mutator protein MutT
MMTVDATPLACIAFMLIQDDRVLLERRSLSKRLLPGARAIPGGHMESGERAETALLRELDEELGIKPTQFVYVCTLLHRAQEFRKLHYFAIDAGWSGDIVVHEADALEWVPLADATAFDLDMDQVAVREYVRVYRSADRASAATARDPVQ